MTQNTEKLTTGLPGLDTVLRGVLSGDNIVWQVDSIEEYRAFVDPYVKAAVQNGKKVVYIRFARHAPLLDRHSSVETVELDPQEGFEPFINRIHDVIQDTGKGAFYVFDCLSRLAVDWCSDRMLGNFFMLTCPLLFDLETVTYFAIYRNYHTTSAISPITQTTQLFLDTYNHKGELYVRPVKAQHRYSSTMHTLHVWRDTEFSPISSSAVIADIMTSSKWSGLASDSSVGFWEGCFIEARELIRTGEYRPDLPGKGKDIYEQIVNMIISRDENMQRLISRFLTIQDVLEVKNRMIGTGLIGGKTVGMLLARAILKRSDDRFIDLLEEHDSFFIGSDVFYTFLVRNGIWWVRDRQRHPKTFLDGAKQARQRIISGDFPADIVKQIEEMLDYYGQSPFIVRSSSLLEDNYGNSFAGKYDSVFCANQGPRDRRLQDLLAAIRTIYASSMSEEALEYRAKRGMLDRDEQMALLVMRVSGSKYEKCFYPQMAGVGFSFNPYVWDREIDPKAGVLRLVFGLGTRAVDRSDDDYTRVVALNAPDKRPETNFDQVARYAQRRVDHLDLESNRLVSSYFTDLLKDKPSLPLSMFATADRQGGGSEPHWVLTFDELLEKTRFVDDMHEILQTLQKAYDYPVDIEYTANFVEDDTYRVNLLQCRPLQVQGVETVSLPRIDVEPSNRIIEARGAVVGQSRVARIGCFVYVLPSQYGQLSMRERYEIATLIGDINHTAAVGQNTELMVLGPGRWGTSSPSLGIPVSFSHINNISVMCEIVAMHEYLVPDVSLGTHFLNELVEMDMLYLALFPDQGDNYMDTSFFENSPSRLLDLVPKAEKWQDTVRVIVTDEVTNKDECIALTADAVEQRVLCFKTVTSSLFKEQVSP